MPAVFPETTLRTGRLVLRAFTPADIPDTQATCSEELTQRWLPLPNPYTLEDATAFCTQAAPGARESGDGIQFAVADPRTGRLLGNIGLKRTSWQARTSEVGYWISPWARGQGIATEATRTLAEWLLVTQRFERLELLAATGNIASQKVAIRAGFRQEGIMRNAGITHVGRVDLAMFSLIPSDL